MFLRQLTLIPIVIFTCLTALPTVGRAEVDAEVLADPSANPLTLMCEEPASDPSANSCDEDAQACVTESCNADAKCADRWGQWSCLCCNGCTGDNCRRVTVCRPTEGAQPAC